MPIYEYQCQQCGARTETLQRLADPPLTECTECGGVLRKLISAPAFQFKGSGWYVTDYARKGGGEGAKEGRSSGGDKAASGDAGGGKETDSKPDKADKSTATKPAAKAASGAGD
jgi:putative FmdB family regulatory protein